MEQIRKELFLHIGSPKTGTTTIQRSFYRARKALLQEGVLYPSIAPKHVFLYRLFSKKKSVFKASGFDTHDSIKKQLEEEKWILESEIRDPNISKIILSSEGLSRLEQDESDLLAIYLKSLADKVTVICYVRDPNSYFPSQIQQHIKNGRLRYSEEVDITRFFSAKKVLPKFIKSFGKEDIIIRDFNREALFQGDLLDDFSKVIGLSPAGCESVTSYAINANESISEEGLIIMDKLHLLMPPRGDVSRLADPVGSVFPCGMDGKKYELSDALWRNIDTAAKIDQQYLSDEFGIKLKQTTKNKDSSTLWSDKALDSIAQNLLCLASNNKSLLSEKIMLEGDILALKNKPNEAITKYYQSIKVSSNLAPAYTRLIKLRAKQEHKNKIQELKRTLKKWLFRKMWVKI